MKFRASTTIVLAVATLSALMLSGCVVAPGPQRARPYGVVEVDVRPPPPRVVVVPAARRGYIWAPGYWRWNGRQHVWMEGHWLRERRGEHWVPAHWEERGNHWHFEDGRWAR